jgi:hypothetical protein
MISTLATALLWLVQNNLSRPFGVGHWSPTPPFASVSVEEREEGNDDHVMATANNVCCNQEDW